MNQYPKLYKPETSNIDAQNNDIIDLETHREETIMSNNTYSKNEIDLKLDKISNEIRNSSEKSDLKFEALMKESSIKFQAMHQKIDDGFKQVDLKFEKLEQKIDDGFEKQRLNTEKMLSDFKLNLVTDQQKNKKEFMYWAIGIIIALIGIAFPIWFGK
ncbi:TPA: hypothetical protein ACIEK0_000241 [Streptococcus pyogenes]